MMGWRTVFAERLRRWLKLEPSSDKLYATIRESYNFETDVMRNRIWYRGDADELRQFFGCQGTNSAASSRFWSAVPTGAEIRKIHSGLPADIVDTLSGLVLSDLDDCDFDNDDHKGDWKKLREKIGFDNMIDTAIREALVTGDGAFKITWDRQQHSFPTVEFYGADRIEYQYEGGLLKRVSFFTDYYKKGSIFDTQYQLEERYLPGKITYILRDKRGSQIPLDTAPETAQLKDVILPSDMLAAVPLCFFASTRWKGRGKSIFANKTDVFDAHDEVVSQWMDAIRCGRVEKYIPADLIPRDSNTLEPQMPGSFGSHFVKLAGSKSEDAASRIDTVQPEIRYDAFLSSYTSTLDMCLRGILSPATLGINISAMSSGESQRERKDITGFTRNTITGELERKLPILISLLMQINDWINGKQMDTYTPTVSFGEYAAPDFSSRVKTIGEASSRGIISVEATVDELWGGSKDDNWKKAEVNRLKAEKGVTSLGEPSAGDDLP